MYMMVKPVPMIPMIDQRIIRNTSGSRLFRYILTAIAINANPRVLVLVRIIPTRIKPRFTFFQSKMAAVIIRGIIMARSREYIINGGSPLGVSETCLGFSRWETISLSHKYAIIRDMSRR
jgi:hypothetical protein